MNQPAARSSSMRRRLYEILEPPEDGDRLSRAFDVALTALIVVNVLAVILETVPEIEARCGHILYVFEFVSVVIFTIEYILRLWTLPLHPRYARPLAGRLRWVFTPFALVDLLAILPFYLPSLISVDLRLLRALRVLRTFRIVKIGRYSKAMQSLWRAFSAKKEELVITASAAGVLLVIASSLMYYAEHDAQPEAFRHIPDALWWGVATLTTVGYGDVYPVTPLGKIIGSFVALLGVGLFALPAGILAAGFSEELKASSQSSDNAK